MFSVPPSWVHLARSHPASNTKRFFHTFSGRAALVIASELFITRMMCLTITNPCLFLQSTENGSVPLALRLRKKQTTECFHRIKHSRAHSLHSNFHARAPTTANTLQQYLFSFPMLFDALSFPIFPILIAARVHSSRRKILRSTTTLLE